MDKQSEVILSHVRAHALSKYSILSHFEVSRDEHDDIIIQDMTNYDWEITGEHKEGTKSFRIGDFPNNIFKAYQPISKGDLTAFRYRYLDTQYLAILDNNKRIQP